MSNTPRLIVLSTVAAVLLGGCGMFGRNKTDYYASQESRPLEVPPDLDSPSATTSMLIPSGSSGSAGSAEAAPADSAPGIAPSIAAGPDSSLRVTDGVAGTWRRVGIAIERSGLAEVVSRDESAGTFTIKGEVVTRESGFFGRMMGRDKVSSETQTRIVRVSADGEGSMIRVEDESGAALEDEAARKVIAALKQRLG